MPANRRQLVEEKILCVASLIIGHGLGISAQDGAPNPVDILSIQREVNST
jgi:hypothetical protein